MKERCPSATFVGQAELKNHRLAFTRRSLRRGCGTADAVPDEAHNVWGVVYEVDEKDMGRLDQAEGYVPGRSRNAYVREKRHVYLDGDKQKPLLISTYFAERQDQPPLPSADYRQQIIDGATYWNLPREYVEKLKKIEIAL